MKTPSDEVLMAYADGELSADQRREVERHLETSREARSTVDAYRRSRELARLAFDAPMREPPPQFLVDAIVGRAPGDASTKTAKAGAGATVIPIDRARAGRARPQSPHLAALSMAASLAFVLGVGLGSLIRTWEAPRPVLAIGKVTPGSDLARTLERRAQGTQTDRLLVVASFRDRDGRPCREVEELRPEGSSLLPQSAAVACRQSSGEWIVEGAVRLTTAVPAASGYAPSGARERDALEGLLTALGAQKVMTADEERKLIEAGWR